MYIADLHYTFLYINFLTAAPISFISIEYTKLTFPHIFFLVKFPISHLYLRTPQRVDRQWTILELSDGDPTEYRWLNLKIFCYLDL
jgi:hypothetical protein